MSERLLVIGGTGMLGHRLVAEASIVVDTWWTARGSASPAQLPIDHRCPGVDVTDPTTVMSVLRSVEPTVVVNCAGTVKQRIDVGTAEMIRTNAVFPHELAAMCDEIGARLVHLSTDCVFSGSAGDRPFGYSESDTPDARDVYGRSKLLGEVDRPGHLTVRTSMIGPELARPSGLLDWFLRAPTPIPGFPRAYFSGLTTPALSQVLLELAFAKGRPAGIQHLAGPSIDKYSLLLLLRDHLRPGVDIRPDDSVRVDRRLDGRRLAGVARITVPSWDEMAKELADLLRTE